MDLGELPFQSTTLPTGVTLRLHRSNYLGSGAHTVGIHDCGNNTWTEDTVSWSTYIPGTQCSTTASASITRVATGSGTWYEWDITSIARNAFTNQNGRMTLALITNWTGTLYFSSSEASSNTPQLVFDFVDNPNGITPPPQVSLQSPADQSVLFEEDGYLLSSSVTKFPVLFAKKRYLLIFQSLIDIIHKIQNCIPLWFDKKHIPQLLQDHYL